MQKTKRLSTLPDDRREAIVHAAWRVAAREGLSAVTIRSIAGELGYTTGIVMHYFATKDAILREMIERLYKGLRETYLKAMAGAPTVQRLESLLLSALPLTRPLVFGWRLSIVLQGEALRSSAIAKLHRHYYRQFEGDIRGELTLLQGADLLARDTDIDQATAKLMVLVEGIGVSFVFRPKSMPPKLQRLLIAEELATLRRPSFQAGTGLAASQL